MDFGFFRAASRSAFRLQASNESGASRQIDVPAGRTTRVGALAGDTFEVIDPATGRAAGKLSARRVGRSLYLQLGDAGAATLVIESYFTDESGGLDRLLAPSAGNPRLRYLTGDGAALSFESLEGPPQTLTLGIWNPPQAVETPPPTPATPATQVIATSSSSEAPGSVASTVTDGTAAQPSVSMISPMATAGVAALGLAAAGGGGGGGGAVTTALPAPPPRPLSVFADEAKTDGVLSGTELSDGTTITVHLAQGTAAGQRLTLVMLAPDGTSAELSETLSAAQVGAGVVVRTLTTTDFAQQGLNPIGGNWRVEARIDDVHGQSSPTVPFAFSVDAAIDVVLSVTAGPVSAGVGIRAFDPQGTPLRLYDTNDQLRDHIAVQADGTAHLRIRNIGYSGPIMFRAIDLNGSAPNFDDEVSREMRSLGLDLRAVEVIDSSNPKIRRVGDSVQFEVNITPLTELAARLAGASESGAPAQASTVIAANLQVAKAFGLEGISITDRPVATHSTAFLSGNRSALTSAEKYGLALAKLSGVDSLNNGRLSDTLEQFERSLKESATNSQPGQLSAFGSDLLDQGRDIALAAAQQGSGTFTGGAAASMLMRGMLGDLRIDSQTPDATGITIAGQAAQGGKVFIEVISPDTGSTRLDPVVVSSEGLFSTHVAARSIDTILVTSIDALGSVVGEALRAPSAPDLLTTSTTQVQGSGTPGDQVELRFLDSNGVRSNAVTVRIDDTGQWLYPFPDQSSTPIKVEARTIDPQGNVSSLSEKAVGQPLLGLVAAGGLDGYLNAGEIVNSKLNFEVTLPAVTLPGDVVRSVLTGPDGGESMISITLLPADVLNKRLQVEFALPDAGDGSYETATTLLGLDGGTAALRSVLVVDTVAPSAPQLDSASGLWLTGRAEPGGRVEVRTADATLLGTSTVTGREGLWAIRLDKPIVPGTALKLRATDLAGNRSVWVDAVTASSEVTILMAVDDAGPSSGLLFFGARTDDSSPLLVGTLRQALRATEQLVLYRDGVAVGNASIEQNNSTGWSFQDGTGPVGSLRAPLVQNLDGASTVYVAKIEEQGYAARPSPAFRLPLFTQAPVISSASVPAAADGDVGWTDLSEQGGVRLVLTLPDRAATGDRFTTVIVNPLGEELTLTNLITDSHIAAGNVVQWIPRTWLTHAGAHRVDASYTSAVTNLSGRSAPTRFTLNLTPSEVRETPLDDLLVAGELSVSWQSGPGNDTLTGGLGNDTLDAGSGDDSVSGGTGSDRVTPGSGTDLVALGSGNDVLIADGAWVGDNAIDTIDGGAGFDTILFLGSSLNLDLRSLTRFGDARLESVERIDITGSGDNTLLIDVSQVADLSDLAAAAAVLVIDGNAGDTVDHGAPGATAVDGIIVEVDANGDGDTADVGEILTTADGTITADFGNGAASYWVYYPDPTLGRLLVNIAVTVI